MLENGYPSEKDLKFIQKFDCSKENVRLLMEYIKDIWWASDWGFVQKKKTDDYESIDAIGQKSYKHKRIVIELHTGGWSGNEDIIRALEKNRLFFCCYWVQSRRGGHYIFEFSKTEWDK
jgi:hypothetical protein